MDIGHVKTDFPFEWQCSPCGQDVDVGAVGQHVQCYRCGGFGHTSRDCGTPKGQGKGGGGGKGPKGGGKGDNVSGKAGHRQSLKGAGKGKGYQGECWKCGKPGHKQWECRGGRSVGAIDEEADEEFDDGAVETIPQGAVSVWRINHVETQNMFQDLTSDDDSDAGDYMEINAVTVDDKDGMIKKSKSKRKVTLDSGAGASCLPKHWVPNVPLKPKKKGVKFVAAEGSNMEYHGRRDLRFRALRSEGGCIKRGSLAAMEFHVTNSNKALASAVDIVEAGNDVVLSRKKGGSYILNEQTGEKIYLRRENGTFVFDIELEDEHEDEVMITERDEDVLMNNAKVEKDSTPIFGRRE